MSAEKNSFIAQAREIVARAKDKIDDKGRQEDAGPVTIGLTALFFIGSIVYTLVSRPLGDVLRNGSYIAAAIAVIGAFSVGLPWAAGGFKRVPLRRFLRGAIVALLVMALGGIIYYSTFSAMSDAYDVTVRLIFSKRSYTIGVITTVVTAVVGLVLFYFRLRLRAVYGLSEAIIGVAVAVQRMTSETDPMKDSGVLLAVLTAGVYLVVRGLDNVHQGLTKEPLDIFALKVLARIRGAPAEPSAKVEPPTASRPHDGSP